MRSPAARRERPASCSADAPASRPRRAQPRPARARPPATPTPAQPSWRRRSRRPVRRRYSRVVCASSPTRSCGWRHMPSSSWRCAARSAPPASAAPRGRGPVEEPQSLERLVREVEGVASSMKTWSVTAAAIIRRGPSRVVHVGAIAVTSVRSAASSDTGVDEPPVPAGQPVAGRRGRGRCPPSGASGKRGGRLRVSRETNDSPCTRANAPVVLGRGAAAGWPWRRAR